MTEQFAWMGDSLRHAWEHTNNTAERNLSKRVRVAALPEHLQTARKVALHTENDWSSSVPQRHINGY
jgi:hypothetical protein